jgi:phospholipase C
VPVGLDPDHSHEAALVQLEEYGGVPNGGFVRSYEALGVPTRHARRVMDLLDPEVQCPVLATLAKEFAVCPSWFSSVRGATWPNRNFAHAATSDDESNIVFAFYHDLTIFELLERSDATWRVYYDGTPQVWCFPRLWRRRMLIDFLLGRSPRMGNWFLFERFPEHVAQGDLATYSFIEPAHNQLLSRGGVPRRTNSQHPHNNLDDNADFVAGERLIREVYESLRQKPELFARTLFVVTYDEHGGLYDHVVPPEAVAPGDVRSRHWTRRLGRIVTRAYRRLRRLPVAAERDDFRRLGVRVPAVLVSPWIDRHTVLAAPDGRPFDHASIPATLRACFAPGSPPLTDRDRAAPTFHHLVTASDLPAPRPSPGEENPHALATLPRLTGVEPPLVRSDVQVRAAAARPPGDLDEDLVALDRRIRRWMRYSPSAVLTRLRTNLHPDRAHRRATIRARGVATTDLFAETAVAARGE